MINVVSNGDSVIIAQKRILFAVLNISNAKESCQLFRFHDYLCTLVHRDDCYLLWLFEPIELLGQAVTVEWRSLEKLNCLLYVILLTKLDKLDGKKRTFNYFVLIP